MTSSSLSETDLAVLGAGAVAGALASALAEASAVRGLAIWSRSPADAVRLREAVAAAHPTRADGLRAAAKLADALAGARLLLLAVADEAIGEVARAAAESAGPPAAGAVALHCSGAAGTEPLAPLSERGWSVGVLHPLVSLSAAGTGSAPFRGVGFALGGDAAARARAGELVRALGGALLEPEEDPDARARYHAAASLLAGGTTVLFDRAEALFAGAVRADPGARRAALAALLRSVAENLSRVPADAALTGPIARGDEATVAAHLAALARAERPDAAGPGDLELYRALSRALIPLARRKGAAGAESLERIARRLSPDEPAP